MSKTLYESVRNVRVPTWYYLYMFILWLTTYEPMRRFSVIWSHVGRIAHCKGLLSYICSSPSIVMDSRYSCGTSAGRIFNCPFYWDVFSEGWVLPAYDDKTHSPYFYSFTHKRVVPRNLNSLKPVYKFIYQYDAV